MKKLILTLVLAVSILLLHAQDIHTAQVYNYSTEVNPAFAGIYRSKIRCVAAYRKQWNSFNSGFRSSYLGADMRLMQSKGGYIGGGMMLLSDQAGSGISLTSAAFHLSSMIHAGESNTFGIGLTAKADQRTYDFNSSTWDAQFDGLVHDPSLPSGEVSVAEKKTVFDAGIGMIWKFKPEGKDFQKRESFNFTMGVSAYHITAPNIAYYGEDKQSIRYNGHLNGYIPLGLIFVRPLFYISQSGQLREMLMGGLVGFGKGTESSYTTYSRKSYIAAGLLYRNKEAVIPALQLVTGDWTIGCSYDITVSHLKEYTRRGGMEIFISYRDMTGKLDKKSSGRRSF